MFTCPVCGRLKCAYWPEHWVYRRGATFYCSDQCRDVDSVRDTRILNDILRERRFRRLGKEEKEMKKITLEQKKKAVQIAFEGGDYLGYLRGLGSKNPSGMWWTIKEDLKKADPKLYAMLPDGRKKQEAKSVPVKVQAIAKAVAEVPEPTLGDAMTGMQEAASTFFGACENMGLNLSGAETPEQPAAVHDDTSDAVRFQIMTIRGEFGEYRISDDDFIYTGAFGDVKGVAEDLGAWLEELKRAAHMLEVEA